jgi:alkylhydroperoxidase/carboxymuconolactone decarboxylase family protein YurZ
MSEAARFQETLRRLAMIDTRFVEDEAIGSSASCLEWSAGRALAAGATQEEIADVLLATALEYDIAAAVEEPDGY